MNGYERLSSQILIDEVNIIGVVTSIAHIKMSNMYVVRIYSFFERRKSTRLRS
jgi:hypothetical protein